MCILYFNFINDLTCAIHVTSDHTVPPLPSPGPALLLPPEPPLSPHPSNLMSSNKNIRVLQGQRKGSLAVQTVSLLTKLVESRYKYSLPDLSQPLVAR